MRLPELLERAVPDGTASGRRFGGIFLLLPVRCGRGIDATLRLPNTEERQILRFSTIQSSEIRLVRGLVKFVSSPA